MGRDVSNTLGRCPVTPIRRFSAISIAAIYATVVTTPCSGGGTSTSTATKSGTTTPAWTLFYPRTSGAYPSDQFVIRGPQLAKGGRQITYFGASSLSSVLTTTVVPCPGFSGGTSTQAFSAFFSLPPQQGDPTLLFPIPGGATSTAWWFTVSVREGSSQQDVAFANIPDADIVGLHETVVSLTGGTLTVKVTFAA